MSWDVASAAGVPVFQPSAPDIMILLVDDKVDILEVSLILVGGSNPCNPGPNTDQPFRLDRVNGFL